MAIKKVKVVFSKFGMRTPSLTRRKRIYMVYADVQVTTQKTHLRVDVVRALSRKRLPYPLTSVSISLSCSMATNTCSSMKREKKHPKRQKKK